MASFFPILKRQMAKRNVKGILAPSKAPKSRAEPSVTRRIENEHPSAVLFY